MSATLTSDMLMEGLVSALEDAGYAEHASSVSEMITCPLSRSIECISGNTEYDYVPDFQNNVLIYAINEHTEADDMSIWLEETLKLTECENPSMEIERLHSLVSAMETVHPDYQGTTGQDLMGSCESNDPQEEIRYLREGLLEIASDMSETQKEEFLGSTEVSVLEYLHQNTPRMR